MAATWYPPWMHKYLNSKYAWSLRFAWIPCRSTESGKIIWLKLYQYGVRLIEGPAGEDPLKLEMRLTPTEYTWFQLANS